MAEGEPHAREYIGSPEPGTILTVPNYKAETLTVGFFVSFGALPRLEQAKQAVRFTPRSSGKRHLVPWTGVQCP